MTGAGKLAAVLALVLLVLLGLLWFGYDPWANRQQGIGEKRATDAYNLAITRQKTAAATLLAVETGKADAGTKQLKELKLQQEKNDAKNQSTVKNLESRLRIAAGDGGRLRDPNAAGCGVGSVSSPGADPTAASPGAADDAETGGLFSAGATELLQRLTREADEINNAYASCRPDAMNVRQVLQ